MQSHPIRSIQLKTFLTAGVPVTLNTDDPVRVWTTIGREYAIAEALDFSLIELLGFTRNAICASFTSRSRKADLLDAVPQWQMRYDVQESYLS